MINPLATRISFPLTSIKLPPNVPLKRDYTYTSVDSFTSSENLNNTIQAETKSNKSFIELLFGNVNKEKKTPKMFNYNRFEADLYKKTNSKEELREFFKNYQPLVRW